MASDRLPKRRVGDRARHGAGHGQAEAFGPLGKARQPGDEFGAGLLRRIIDSLPDGVVVADSAGRLVLFNTAALRVLTLGPMDVPLSEWSSVYGCYRPDMTTPYPSEELPLARSLRGETVRDSEIYIRRGGSPAGKWITTSSMPVRTPDGTVSGAVVALRDITTERARLDRMRLLSTVVDQTADSVLVTNPAGRIEYVNGAFEGMTGFTAEEVLGKDPSLLKSGLHSTHFYEQLWSALVQGKVFRGTLTDRRKNGELFKSDQTITPILNPDGFLTHLVSVARDVTDQSKAAARESSLQLARLVQRRLYPQASPVVPGLDVCGASIAADVVSGDYFDFVTLPGGSLGVVIGDVSGHGFDSAILMAQVRAVLRSFAHVEADPGRILGNVNRVLVPDMAENRFVGMVLVEIDARRRQVRYANAGHTSGYVLDKRGSVRAELGSTGVPLGLFADAPFATRPVPGLSPGDVLVLFTDGITEAFAADDSMFGAEPALDVVRASADQPAAVILDNLLCAVRRFSNGALTPDDVTAVVCKAMEV